MSLITKREIQSLAIIALPLAASFLAQKGMQLIDTIMMGWIGPYALAAGALGTSIFMMLIVFSMGILNAVGIFITRARGAQHLALIPGILQQGFWIIWILSIPCMLIIYFTPHFLSWLHEDEQVIAYTSSLLHGLVWGFPGFLCFILLRELISSFALTGIIMVVSILALPLTFITNDILIYGKLGFPKLGIAGIGYAGAIIMWFMFLCLLIYSRCYHHLKNHTLSLQKMSFDVKQVIAIFSLGLPSGMVYLLDMGMFSIAAFMMTHFGVAALAAHQIAIQCVTVAYSIPFAFSMAVALQVSHSLGSNDRAQAIRYVYLGVSSGLILALLIALLFVLFPQFFIHFFIDTKWSHNQYIVHLAVSFLFGSALFQCFDALQGIMNGALRGFKDTFVPMLVCLTCYWILGVGGGYYLAFHTQIGPMGIWYGLVLGLSSSGLILVLRFLQLQRI